ncbi:MULTISPECIES: transposase family protein [unclassified Streptomyces]|uniref:transposase family protein n=1 Tax=unclassified Streptomyces TaxID=2593676 RepID=UPI003800E974
MRNGRGSLAVERCLTPQLFGRGASLVTYPGSRPVSGSASAPPTHTCTQAYLGAGGTFATPTRRPPRKELTARQRSLNRAHARLRYPAESGMATLKRWRLFRHARCSPNRLSSAGKAILTLEKQR